METYVWKTLRECNTWLPVCDACHRCSCLGCKTAVESNDESLGDRCPSCSIPLDLRVYKCCENIGGVGCKQKICVKNGKPPPCNLCRKIICKECARPNSHELGDDACEKCGHSGSVTKKLYKIGDEQPGDGREEDDKSSGRTSPRSADDLYAMPRQATSRASGFSRGAAASATFYHQKERTSLRPLSHSYDENGQVSHSKPSSHITLTPPEGVLLPRDRQKFTRSKDTGTWTSHPHIARFEQSLREVRQGES